MSSLDQVYIKQKEKLFSLYKNNLPQSIILSGGEIELLSDIAISFSELIVKNNIDHTFEDFLNICSNENHIKLAVGRNYNDCSPVKGFFKGNEKQEMEVKVFVDTKKNTDNYDFHYDENLNNKIESNDDENVDFQNSYRKRLEVIQQQQQQQ